MLVNDPYGLDQPTEMKIVDVRKDPVENRRAFTVHIVEEFPSFVTTRDLVLRVPGRLTERSWEILGDACNSVTMILPDGPSKYSPGPDAEAVVVTSIGSCAP
jgi:hypothetical protein